MQPEVREDAGGKRFFRLYLGGAHVASLRVKGKVRAREGRKQASESPRLAWGKEDEAAALGAPCSRGILTTVSALGQSSVSPV